MYEIQVAEMTSGSCANSIKQVLKQVDAEVDVKIDIKSQTVVVRSNQKEEVITQLIKEAGFPVLGSRKIA